MKTACSIFHKLFSTYFHKFFKIAYGNYLYKKTINLVLSFAIEIVYANLYKNAYYDKCLCYKLLVNFYISLPK